MVKLRARVARVVTNDIGAASVSLIVCAVLGFVTLGFGSIQLVTWFHCRNVAQAAAQQAATAAADEGATARDGEVAGRAVSPGMPMTVTVSKGLETVQAEVRIEQRLILVGTVSVTGRAETGVERFVANS